MLLLIKKEKKDFYDQQCHHHFLVNQEKAEKHVFRKSKKYRTLCSVALGTMVTAVVAWGGQVAQADEVVTSSQGKTVQLTENPATNLPEAQPTPVAEQTDSLASTGQSDGDITVTVPHDVVTKAVNQATAEGVTTIQDKPMDLGTPPLRVIPVSNWLRQKQTLRNKLRTSPGDQYL